MAKRRSKKRRRANFGSSESEHCGNAASAVEELSDTMAELEGLLKNPQGCQAGFKKLVRASKISGEINVDEGACTRKIPGAFLQEKRLAAAQNKFLKVCTR